MRHSIEQMMNAGGGEWTPQQWREAERCYNFAMHEDRLAEAYLERRPISLLTPKDGWALVEHYTIFEENLPEVRGAL